MNVSSNRYILPLQSVGINDIENVEGKNASLGEMLQNLTAVGINIPYGFVITVVAYRKFYKIITLRIILKTLLIKLIRII